MNGDRSQVLARRCMNTHAIRCRHVEIPLHIDFHTIECIVSEIEAAIGLVNQIVPAVEPLSLVPRGEKWRSSVRLCAPRGPQDSLQFGIQFPRDLRDSLVAKLSEKRRWEVVLEDRLPRLILVKHDAQRRIESGR